MSSPRLYLASASPRRRELLAQLQLEVSLLPQQLDESTRAGEPPQDYVLRLAREKARACLDDPRCQLALPVLAADTTVVCDGEVLGKPRHLAEALDMLGRLSGRQHQVLTAVVVADRQRQAEVCVSTLVSFRRLDERDMLAYWHSGEPLDKAGGYAIQGLGALFVSRIEGSYSAVVGLPLFETVQLLAEFGISTASILEGSRS